MRKPDAATVAATPTPITAGRRDDSPAEVVCMALVLALLALGWRIAIVW